MQSRPMWLLRRPLLAVVLSWNPLKLLCRGKSESRLRVEVAWQGHEQGQAAGFSKAYHSSELSAVTPAPGVQAVVDREIVEKRGLG